MEIILEIEEAVKLLKKACIGTCCNDCPYTYDNEKCRLSLPKAKEPWNWGTSTRRLV